MAHFFDAMHAVTCSYQNPATHLQSPLRNPTLDLKCALFGSELCLLFSRLYVEIKWNGAEKGFVIYPDITIKKITILLCRHITNNSKEFKCYENIFFHRL